MTFTSLFIVCAKAQQTRAYCIQNSKGQNCTATLLNIDNKCRLVTNAHCVNDGSKEVSIKSIKNFIPNHREEFAQWQKYINATSSFSTRDSVKKNLLWEYERKHFDENLEQDLSAKILIFDNTKDLAEIELPNFLQNSCKDFKYQWHFDDESVNRSKQGVMSVGCTRENQLKETHPKVSYTKDTIYEVGQTTPSFKAVKIERIPSAYKDSDHLYYIRDLSTTPGQSGGPTITSSGGFLGIQTRANLTQDRVWVIPAKDVYAFLRNPTQSNDPNPYVTPNSALIGDSDGTGTGDSDGTGTGDGDGTGTGDSDGTGTRDDCRFVDSSLQFFSSREDQFLEQIGDIMITLDGKILNEPGEITKWGNEANRYQRDQDGYPSLEWRKKTLPLLLGHYDFNESMHKRASRFRENEKWNLNQAGALSSSLDIKQNESSNNFSIHLNFSLHPLQLQKVQFDEAPTKHEPESSVSFQASYSDDFKTIILKNDQDRLVCPNKHVAKLFCRGSNKSLSISAENINSIGSGLKYRYVEANEIRSDYYYGER